MNAAIRRGRWLIGVAWLLYLLGCEQDPATQVIVVVRSDLAIGSELAELAIEVKGASGEPVGDQRRYVLAAETGDGKFALPLSFVVVPPDGESDGRFRLVVRGLDASGADLVEQQVIAAFRTKQTVLLEVFLPSRCLRVLCREEQENEDVACRQESGRCEPIEQQLDLPTVEPGTELETRPAADAGSDASVPPVTCPAGLRGNAGGGCDDIDECEQNNGGCADLPCENTHGSYSCGDCDPGFGEDGDGHCVDIDECLGGTANCTAGMDCRNVLGGFVCSCPAGFEPDAEGCTDIDECVTDNGGCGAVECHNSAGSYACGACGAGFGEDPSGACIDLDECASDNGGCDRALCVNENGSYACSPTECASDFADCDMQAGCEVDKRVDAHDCGACDNDCSMHANVESASCAGGTCDYDCKGGFKDCNDEPGCETRVDSVSNCGDCGMRCSTDNGTAACAAGRCAILTCNASHLDCDGKVDNGCEHDRRPFEQGGDGPCPPDPSCTRFEYGQERYFYCSAPMAWGAAQIACASQPNGTLAQVNDASENAALRSRIAADSWIGGAFDSESGGWEWVNDGSRFWTGGAGGTASAYANWADAEPATQGCAAISFGNGGWSAADCSAERPYLCELQPDLCPDDQNKISPGQCGCGEPETDADDDGAADCVDQCDADPNKTAAGLCGCGVPDTDRDSDGTPDCNDACASDPTKTGPCLGFVPTNFDTASLNFGTQPTSNLSCGTTTLDTTDPDGAGPGVATLTNWCGAAPLTIAETQSAASGVVVVALRGLTIASGMTLRVVGNRPAIFAVDGNVTIAGVLRASGSGSTPGAGGDIGCGSSRGGDGTGSSSSGAGGGGGGAFGTAGGRGGLGGGGARGIGGAIRGNSNLSPLIGGCGGGLGGGCTARAAGGGAVQISASGTVAVTGLIDASGAAGANGCGTEGGGGGGGSGGAIFIEAKTINVDASLLHANGGSGGGGAGGPSGATGSTNMSVAGTDGTDNSTNGAPGGGGGYGRIRTLTR